MSKIASVAALVCLCTLAGAAPASAQGWTSWADEAFGRSGSGPPPRWSGRERRLLEPDLREQRSDGDIREGGPRPAIEVTAPPVVAFAHDFPAKSIVIVAGERKLYYVLGEGKAYAYPVSVGREGFNWTGTEVISRKQAWPDWHPPAEMRDRDPSLPEKMTGGIRNPLGAMALYLGKTLYRIHGTNDVRSIGRAESSGCFRMLNSDVLHLASISEIGTSVSVVQSLRPPQQVSQVPAPASQQPGPLQSQ
jgi:lipoprotein-anchoring transpeptidase ErfK/SrfK